MAQTTGRSAGRRDQLVGEAEIAITNPVTGEQVGRVRTATPEEVVAAVRRAREAQPRWAGRSYRERAKVFRRLHDLVLRDAARLLDTIQDETGKARRDALTEILALTATIRYYVHHGERHVRERRRAAAAPLLTSARISYMPRGVVGLITPWNYPLLLGLADAVPALLAGNAVVTKPSETAPLSTHAGVELAIEAGLDPDLFQIIDGAGAPAEELVRHVDFIGFTGGSDTGRTVAEQCARELVPCSLELGGKNPMIVLAGARIEDAVSGLVNGAFPNSGQSCVSIERVYVEDAIYDRFVERAVERVRGLRIGWSQGWEFDVGSLIDAEHADKAELHVTDARERGASVLVGGQRLHDLGPAFFEPTLLSDVTDDMLVAQDETFGPVTSIQRVHDAEEAIALANRSRYGLNASIWAGDSRRAHDVARRLHVGSACINATMLVYVTLDVPMGGVRDSGIGRRHGAPGITRFTVEKSVVRSVGYRGGFESVPRLVTSDAKASALYALYRAWNRIPGLR